MTLAYENQFDLKHYTKADSNDIELALIGIEIMEEIRPVLIISNDIGNRHSPTVITSRVQTKSKLPTHTAVNDFEGLDKDSVVLLEQIRTVDKKRLKQYMGMMPTETMARVDKALAISISLKNGSESNCAN